MKTWKIFRCYHLDGSRRRKSLGDWLEAGGDLMPLAGRPLETPIHIPNRLRAMLALAPDDIALVSVASSYTWRELNRASDNLAGNLLRLGLTPGDRIASLMPNRPELIVHYIACMKSGFVAVPLNYRYKVSEIDRALAVSGASILLAHAEREEELRLSTSARAAARPYNPSG
jgi:long-chain acyl-CoA synthetase